MGNKKILVVDDESDMRIFVSVVVETMGFLPVTAQDGAEALEKARTHLPEAYMEKPPDAGELSELISELLPEYCMKINEKLE